MKALVTGASGFIGKRLVWALLEEGTEVTALVRQGSEPTIAHAKLKIRALDGSAADLRRAVRESGADTCFHLATHFLAGHQPEQVGELVDTNVRFGAQLVDALVEAKIPRLVNAGTIWQHFESRDYSPVALYAATKQALEDIIQFYAETADLRVIHLKLYDSYGPGDRRRKIFALLKEAAEQRQTLEMTPGDQYIDLVYIDDTVRAFLAADRWLKESALPARGHWTFTASSGKPIKVRELVETFGRVTGFAPPVKFGGREYRPREMMKPWTVGEPLPGWKPLVSLEEGIRKIYGSGA